MKRSIQILLLVLLSATTSFAQKTFTGIVYANSTQQPLEGVSITVKGGVGAAVTDKEGKFSLQSYLKAPTLIFNYQGVAVQERTYKKKKVSEVMTVDAKYLGKKKSVQKTIDTKDEIRYEEEDLYFYNQISELSIKEDILYAENKKKVYRDIKAISLFIPGEYNPIGISKHTITFDFKDVEQLLVNHPNTRWTNAHNPLQKSDYLTALQQHWYKSSLFLYRNPVNDKIEEVYREQEWEKLRNLYRNQGDLFKDVREKWQSFGPAQFSEKPKKVKLPKKYTDLSTFWFTVKLTDSLNQSFLSDGRELSRLLIEAFRSGKIKGYTSDKLDKQMPMAQFIENITMPGGDEGYEDEEMGFGDDEDDAWGEEPDGGGGWNSRVTIPIESSREEYAIIRENSFFFAKDEPLSTFSIDVDRASYSNMRRFLNANQFPPKDAIRIEELINYFDYDYQPPKGKEPFGISTEVAACPWNSKNQLVKIGLQGKDVKADKLPPMNLVFLLDVSGSMNDKNKLPLLKESLKLLMNQLRPKDRVAIVVYAGAAGLVLPSTPASEKDSIIAAFDRLQAGGATAGGEGILLAYQIARQHFIEQGNNRIIIATDGDFNVGVSSKDELERLIEEQRESGVFLTLLGFGMGNLKDSRMETLADKGNGNYAYIDNLQEAKKVLVKEFAGTLFAIAKDVKIQVEFNPSQVSAYRLIGYENRVMEHKEFNDDKKDAGELGAGHTVTALYEIVPAKNGLAVSTDLKYQNRDTKPSSDLLTVKLRYKEPDGDKSKLIEQIVKPSDAKESGSESLQFAANVAQFGMLLRDSPYKGATTYAELIEAIGKSLGTDKDGYRKEFESLVKKGLKLLEVQ